MSQQIIDGKVVEMKFDNSNFEKNVAESMSTLDKLKQALNFDSANALKDLGKSAKSFNLDGVSSAVQTVQANFSAMQVIGMTALSEITKSALKLGATLVNKVVSPIKSGGMNRAMNIANAKFQLEGLGVAWNQIEEDINYGVKDTAYGLDSAAKAASQLVASGVSLGENMKASLRGISGVAAMTNATYEEISPIFTTVAGQGKLMTMQLRQLESRGLNAAATLGKELGKTETEIRDMVTKGEIDFQTFATAMDSAFGQHAKDANKTFVGALSNVKAALSRIGANFATPYMDNMQKIFVGLIGVINGINKELTPVYNTASRIMTVLQRNITGFLGSIGIKNGYISIINSFRNAFYALLLVVTPIKEAINEIFPKTKGSAKAFADATRSIEKFVSGLVISQRDSKNLKDTFRGLFAVLDILKEAFSGLFRAISPYTGVISDVVSNLLNLTGSIGRYLVSVRDSVKETDYFGQAFSNIADKVANVGSSIKTALGKIIDAIKDFKKNKLGNADFGGLTALIDSLKGRISTLGGISGMLSKIFGGIKNVMANFAPVFHNATAMVADAITTLLNGFAGAFKGTGNDPFTAFLNVFSTATVGTLVTSITQVFGVLFKQIKNMGGISSILTTIKVNLVNTFAAIQADLKADVLTKIAKAIAVLAGSILVLSLINPGRLIVSLTAVETLLQTFKRILMELSLSIQATDKITASVARISLAAVFMSMATGILVLAGAIKILSSVNVIDLTKGMGAVLILMSAMSKQAILLSNLDTKIMKGASTMIALALAVKILASAVKKLGELPFGELIKGLGSTIALLYAMAGAIKLLDGVKLRGNVGLSFVEIAASLIILSVAVKKFSDIPLLELVKGMGAVIVGMYSMAGALAMLSSLSKGGKLIAAGLALIEVSASITIFSNAVKSLSSIPLANIAQGVGAAVIAIVAMTTALGVLSNISSGGSLMATSAALLLVSVAVSNMAGAFKKLSEVPFLKMLGSIAAIIGVIAGFAIITTVLTPVIPLMLALSGAVSLLGIGVSLLGVGVVALSAGLASLATSATVIIANLGAIGTIIVNFIPILVTTLANGIATFISTLARNAASIVKSVVDLGHEILTGLTTLIPDILNLIVTLAKGIADKAPEFAKAAVQLIVGLMNGIAEAAPQLIAGVFNLIASLIMAIPKAVVMLLPDIGESGAQVIDEFVSAVTDVGTRLKDAGANLVKGIKDGVKDAMDGIGQLGKDFANGFIKGINGGEKATADAASNLAKAGLNAVKRTQRSNSPSKETISLARDFTAGYNNTIEDGAKGSAKAGEKLVASSLSAIDAYAKRYGKGGGLFESLFGDQKKTAEAANQNADAQNNLAAAATSASEAVGKEDKSVKSLKDTIEGAMDIFSQFKTKTEMTGDEMLNNLRTNLIGISSWTTKLAVLAERGISKTLYDKLAEMGPKSLEQVNAFINMTADELREANRLYTQSLTFSENQSAKIAANYAEATKRAKASVEKELKDSTAAEKAAKQMGVAIAVAVGKPIEEQADDIAESAADLGEGAVDAIAEELEDTSEVETAAKDLGETVVESFEDGLKRASIEDGALQFKAKVADLVKSQLDIFEEFDAKTELTAQKMLENMESNIKGVASWSSNLAKLAKKGISQGLLEQLGELGPKGYEKVNAFVQMTDEELKKANELFAQSLTLSQTQSDIAADSFRYAGEMAVLGFSNALADQGAIQEVGTAVKGITDEVKAVLTGELDIHSPSRVTYGFGTNTIDGYHNAIVDGYSRIALVIQTLTNIIKANFNAQALANYFYNAGMNATLGFANGIGNSSAAARVIAEAQNIANIAISTMRSALDEHSPSRALEDVGSLGTDGFVIGISKGADNVKKAAHEVASVAVDSMANVAGRIQDVLNVDTDFNPVITPMLDLSLIKSQIDSLNAMFGSATIGIGINGQNGGSQIVQPQQNFSFTQINNSPKAINATEVYRQTRNQFAQLKGAVYGKRSYGD